MLYESGTSFADVAQQMGVTRSTAMRIVRSRGIEVRSWGVKYRKAEPSEFRCQPNCGYTPAPLSIKAVLRAEPARPLTRLGFAKEESVVPPKEPHTVLGRAILTEDPRGLAVL